MTVIAEAQLEIDRPASELFDALCDYRNWRTIMPKAFSPMRGPERALRVGDRMTVRMNGALPAQLTVLRVEPHREICWRGGLAGLLVGEHSFLFEELGPTRARVRSREPFTGLLTKLPPVAKTLRRDASVVGLQMLEGLRDFRR
jgi:hypothetical protein